MERPNHRKLLRESVGKKVKVCVQLGHSAFFVFAGVLAKNDPIKSGFEYRADSSDGGYVGFNSDSIDEITEEGQFVVICLTDVAPNDYGYGWY